MSDLFEAARPLLARLAVTLDQQPDLRHDLAAFARAAVAFFESGGTSTSGPLTPLAFPRPSGPLFSSASASPYRFGPSGEGTPYDAEREQVPLSVMAKRCKVKAEACRLLVKRFGGSPPETDESMPLFKRAAELPDCGLWMLTGSGFNPTPAVWENLAGAYEAASVACDLLDRVLPRNDVGLEIGLNLAAESQSTLLYAVVDTGRRGPDTDQIELFIRIRETGAQRRIYIPKFLKRDDRADPDNWKDVLARLTREFEPYKSLPPSTPDVSGKPKSPDKPMHSVQYHLKKVKESPSTANWPWIFKLIDEAIATGLSPADPGLRDLFLPVADLAPDDVELPANVALVYREIDRYLSSRPSEERPIPETPSQEVVKAAILLGGKVVALVGGLPRPLHQKSIIEAFDLKDLRWLAAPEPTPASRFESDIARPEVALVLHAFRWSSADEAQLQAICEKYRKPLVRLPRGYNPNQIATELLRQAGDRLRGG